MLGLGLRQESAEHALREAPSFMGRSHSPKRDGKWWRVWTYSDHVDVLADPGRHHRSPTNPPPWSFSQRLRSRAVTMDGQVNGRSSSGECQVALLRNLEDARLSRSTETPGDQQPGTASWSSLVVTVKPEAVMSPL